MENNIQLEQPKANRSFLEKWESKNIWVRDAKLEDAEELQQLCNKSEYLRKWEGTDPIDPKHMEKMILEGDLPPNGTKENFKIQGFYLKETNQLIGYMTYYFGYPEEDILWLNFLFIDPEFQGKGYSSEIINRFMELLKSTTYNKVRLLVKLKNWPAMRFWTKHHFTKIISYHGDAILSEQTFAGLVIEREVEKNRKVDKWTRNLSPCPHIPFSKIL